MNGKTEEIVHLLKIGICVGTIQGPDKRAYLMNQFISRPGDMKGTVTFLQGDSGL